MITSARAPTPSPLPTVATARPVHVSQPASVIAVGDKVEIKTATKDCDESVTA